MVFASIKTSSNHLSPPSDRITLKEVGAEGHTLCSEFGDISHIRYLSSFQNPPNQGEFTSVSEQHGYTNMPNPVHVHAGSGNIVSGTRPLNRKSFIV